MQAAADGVGVAMGIRPYIDDDLAAGRLVAPFALTVPKGKQWYLVYRDFRKDQRDFVAFRKWLLRASRKRQLISLPRPPRVPSASSRRCAAARAAAPRR